MNTKTPEQIGREYADKAAMDFEDQWLADLIAEAVKADRAQTQPEIYIVQNDIGDVVDVFRDADEATEAYQGDNYSVIEETVWEPGEYRAAVAEIESQNHEPVNWWTPGVFPSCSCGFSPRDNRVLNEHWRTLGFKWADNRGQLVRTILAGEGPE